MADITDNVPKKKGGNPNFYKGMPALNPGGRPPGTSSIRTQIQTAFIEMMKTEVEHDGRKTSFFNAFNEVFAKDAMNPGSQAFKFLADRLYGQDILENIDAQVNRARSQDRDFAMYRILKLGFDIQQRVLLSQARDIGLMAGRRAGKTETNKLLAMTKIESGPNKRVLIIGLTIMKTVQLYWDGFINLANELGYDITPSNTENNIVWPSGGIIQLGGNSNKLEREKYRGQHWDLIIVDEAQSHENLGMFVAEILNPMLIDTNGVLCLTGSGPRTRGTFWEKYFTNPTPSGLRLNWNLSSNPFIHDYQNALAKEREKHGLAENDPLYMREYLGLICYDDDALVYRLTKDNTYTNEEMLAWMATQSPEDIRFIGGLDYGFRDADAYVVVMYSEKSNEKFVVYEYKIAGTDVTQLCEAVKQSKEYIATSQLFAGSYRRDFDIFADTSDQKITMELNHRYGIPVHNAIKYDKSMAIQNLQDEVRCGYLKVKEGGILWEEFLRMVFKRLEIEGQPSIVTREIDDDIFHADAADALLYALRNYWLTHPQHTVNKVDNTIPQPMSQEEYIEKLYSRPNREQLY